MNNTGAIIRFILSVAVCATVIFGTIFDNVFFNDSKTSVLVQKPASQEVSEYLPYEKEDDTVTQENTEQQDEQSAAVPASSTGIVQGKIIEKFISPYTANHSYNNVYLKNNTELDLDLKSLLNSSLNFKISKNDEPQVLIVHTHATESYQLEERDYYTDLDLSRTTNGQYNMTALGKIVADKLNNAGIKTIHDTTLHDYPSYSESYSRAAETICDYTEKYPSIKIVIDLHRDAIAQNDTDKVKLVTEVDGKKAAQIMLVMGSQSGNVTNFPNWQENLKLALKMQQTIEVMYPSLARSIHFMSKNYNESLTNGSVLIEIGTDGNTFDEAKYSAELLGNALVSLMNTI